MGFLIAERSINLLCRAVIALLAIAVIVVLSFVLFYSNHGIDLTDEGYYLLWMANPSSYLLSVSQFGFLLNPLYKLVNGNIVFLRQINYIFTFCLAWSLCFLVIFNYWWVKQDLFKNKFYLASLSAAISLPILLVTCFETPQSPSYNTITIQSLLIGIIAINFMDSIKFSMKLFGSSLLGIAWWLAFMAKPTSGLLFVIASVIYYFVLHKQNLQFLALSIIIAIILFVAGALIIDGSLKVYIFRQVDAVRIFVNTLKAGHESWTWQPFPLAEFRARLFILSSFLTFFLIIFMMSNHKLVKSIGFCAGIMTIFSSSALISGFLNFGYEFARYDGFQILAIPMGCILVSVVFKGKYHVNKDDLALLSILIVMPFVYAFGTNRPIWLNVEGAVFFLILFGVVFYFSAAAGNRNVLHGLIGISCVTILFTGIFIRANIDHPFRQSQSLQQDSSQIVIDKKGNTLVLSQDFANFITEFRQLMSNSNDSVGISIIDFTNSPGLVYTLGLIPPAFPWFPVHYKGSVDFATKLLSKVHCEITLNAWIIVDRETDDGFAKKVMKRLGVDIDNYHSVGTVNRPNLYKNHGTVSLLKPAFVSQHTMTLCEQNTKDF